jgi:AmmeMemoRadiSam system protein B
MDSENFYQNNLIGEIEACGFAGVLSLLQLQEKMKDTKLIELNYTHSGYTSNDFTQVVGYLSAALISS